jgi:hypothetical protein
MFIMVLFSIVLFCLLTSTVISGVNYWGGKLGRFFFYNVYLASYDRFQCLYFVYWGEIIWEFNAFVLGLPRVAATFCKATAVVSCQIVWQLLVRSTLRPKVNCLRV